MADGHILVICHGNQKEAVNIAKGNEEKSPVGDVCTSRVSKGLQHLGNSDIHQKKYMGAERRGGSEQMSRTISTFPSIVSRYMVRKTGKRMPRYSALAEKPERINPEKTV